MLSQAYEQKFKFASLTGNSGEEHGCLALYFCSSFAPVSMYLTNEVSINDNILSVHMQEGVSLRNLGTQMTCQSMGIRSSASVMQITQTNETFCQRKSLSHKED